MNLLYYLSALACFACAVKAASDVSHRRHTVYFSDTNGPLSPISERGESQVSVEGCENKRTSRSEKPSREKAILGRLARESSAEKKRAVSHAEAASEASRPRLHFHLPPAVASAGDQTARHKTPPQSQSVRRERPPSHASSSRSHTARHSGSSLSRGGFLPSAYPFRPEAVDSATRERETQVQLSPMPLTLSGLKDEQNRILGNLLKYRATTRAALNDEENSFLKHMPKEAILDLITDSENALRILKATKKLFAEDVVRLRTIQKLHSKADSHVERIGESIRKYTAMTGSA